jgi:hypothetical protein
MLKLSCIFPNVYIYICIYLYTYISLFICIWTKDRDTSEERRFICFHRGVMLFDLLKDTGTTRWLHEFWLSRSCDIFYLVISFVLFLWIWKSFVVMTPWLQTTLPSGKRLHNYGKSPCLMGKNTISMAMINSYVWHNQRVIPGIDDDYYMIIYLGKL